MQSKLESANAINKLFTLVFLLCSMSGFATTYYVSSTGSDSNPGTSTAGAWATINKVNNTVFLPGDTLYFEGGQTFTGNIYLNGSDANDPNNIFVISSYGTGRATINSGISYGFYAYNTQGFSLSNLIFDGNSMLTDTSSGVRVFADSSGNIKLSNISVSNIEIKNFGADGVKIGSWNNLTGYQNLVLDNLSVHDIKTNGIQIYGDTSQVFPGWPHRNVSISNCEVYNVPGFSDPSALVGNGIVVSGVDSGVIQNCVAHDNGQNNTHCGGPGGIWCLICNNFTIQFCESYRNHKGTGSGCDGLGFDLDGAVTNSVMQYNYSHENDGAGYLMGQYKNARPWSNNTVRYNISENDAVANQGSIGLFKGPGTTMSGVNIYNNTVYVSPQAANNNDAAVYFTSWTTGINNVAFYNNIFFSTGGVPFIGIPSGYSAFFAGNIYWSSGDAFSIYYQGNHYTSLASWRTATNNEVVNGANTGNDTDPLLISPGTAGTIGYGSSLMSLNAYKIKNSSSPAVNTALDLNSLYSINTGNRDFWGTFLPGGNSNDIGANQFVSTLPITLLSFYGNCSGSENNLFWATAEEINMKSIDMMYSSGGLNFSKLADIKPKGSNSRYSYVNDLVSPGDNYYQLKMTDLDGSITYSPVVDIICGEPTNKISVWPNPFSRSLHISIESISGGPATMALYDATGKMLSEKKVQLPEGNSQTSYDELDDLPAGAYYLQILHEGKAEHFKLLKTGK
jgi:hypothetical protein